MNKFWNIQTDTFDYDKSKGELIHNLDYIAGMSVEEQTLYKKWVEYAFGWMKEVRQAWENQTIPQKNYRANSKICKACPIQKVCAEAEVGVIKIKSLEELDETV